MSATNKRLKAENERLKRDLEAVVKMRVAELDTNKQLREWKHQTEDAYSKVMAETCGDEKHCTCVPLLRVKIEHEEGKNARLGVKIDELEDEVKRLTEGVTGQDPCAECGKGNRIEDLEAELRLAKEMEVTEEIDQAKIVRHLVVQEYNIAVDCSKLRKENRRLQDIVDRRRVWGGQLPVNTDERR